MSTIQIYQDQINKELADPKTVGALMQTTFKGIKSQELVKQAVLDGMIRGFTLTDFFKKKVYATPFNVYNKVTKKYEQTYALVESIANVRETAAESGQNGKSEPHYEYNGEGEILSCKITIYKKDGHEGGYTAKVFFKEFEKQPTTTSEGKVIPGMWQTKPHAMIAKVAEMHALRSAFPEKLGQSYVEEEFQKEETIHYDEPVTPPEKPDELEPALKMIRNTKTAKPLETYRDTKLPISKYDEKQRAEIAKAIEDRIQEIQKAK